MPNNPSTSTIREVSDYLRAAYPIRLAESWDNVGLLVGNDSAPATRIMTCLTVTPESAEEAIEEKVQLIVSHHPLPFHSFKRLTTELTPTRLLWQLAQAGVSIYSPHTAFDSAAEGINQFALQRLNCVGIQPLLPKPGDPDGLGAGRAGDLPSPSSLGEFAARVKTIYDVSYVQIVGQLDRIITRCASACGSGGSFVGAAADAGCDALLTGEATFHDCLEARARNIALILVGHYASERFGVELMAERLALQFPGSQVWPSRRESDPLQIV
ncbi:MAG: Nif3-like dinuclear metal center hexameric protein [Planctomycetota bacterium]|jgi:dinuclear metal center YbgI/SA1388 family protein